jgi:hypothetical protein
MLEVNPFERMNWPAHGCSEGSIAYWVVFKQEMWWFQIRTQVIAKYVPSLLEYLSMQAGFRFNIEGLKERVEQAIAASKGMRTRRDAGECSHREAAFRAKSITPLRKSADPLRSETDVDSEREWNLRGAPVGHGGFPLSP